jgi:hypothetical protein
MTYDSWRTTEPDTSHPDDSPHGDSTPGGCPSCEPMSMKTELEFGYLLNALEDAAAQREPSRHGYAEKRAAVLAYVAHLQDHHDSWEAIAHERHETLAVRDTEIARLREEGERHRGALENVSAIRDSIVGCQGFNFSEHAYPLVAVLDGAGFPGAGYEIARENLGTLIDQIKAAESQISALKAALAEACDLAMSFDVHGSQPGERERLSAIRAASEVGS